MAKVYFLIHDVVVYSESTWKWTSKLNDSDNY